jgi:hypothetical protein
MAKKTVLYKMDDQIHEVQVSWSIEKIEKFFCRVCSWFKINGKINIVYERK